MVGSFRCRIKVHGVADNYLDQVVDYSVQSEAPFFRFFQFTTFRRKFLTTLSGYPCFHL
jgi:hypothetical protein